MVPQEAATKTCSKCKVVKTPSDFYGGNSWCKVCKLAHSKTYGKSHPEVIKKARKKYASSNPERRREQERKHDYRRVENGRKWNAVHKEYIRQRDREKYQKDPTYKIQKAHERRARELGASGSHTIEQFLELCVKAKWKCSYCGCQLTFKTVTRDHIVPLSKGGSNDIGNIAASCKPCNSRKGTKTLPD